MRLPRDVSGDDLAKALAELGYRFRATRASASGDVASHVGLTREALVERLFGR